MNKVEEQKTRQLLIHRIPVELLHKFKVKCTKEGKTMRQVVIRFLEEYTKNE